MAKRLKVGVISKAPDKWLTSLFVTLGLALLIAETS